MIGALSEALLWLDTTDEGAWLFTGLLLCIGALCWMGRKG